MGENNDVVIPETIEDIIAGITDGTIDPNPEVREESVPEPKVEAKKPEEMMHADYTKKTQALAEQRRAVEAKAAALAERESALRELLKVPVEVDMLDQSTWQKHIEQLFAKTQLAEIEKERAQANEAARAARVEHRRSEIASFKAEHSDFEEHLDAISDLVATQNLSVEQAYFVAVGRKQAEMRKAQANRTAQSVRNIGTGSRIGAVRSDYTPEGGVEKNMAWILGGE